ncbi:MAG: hypothetical protein KKH98_07135 [Spirochaetes bacterium]|nr:hypothetical protein [Spirochaetota bacterium]
MNRNKRTFISLFILLFVFFSCSSDKLKKWADAEVFFYTGKYTSAVDEIRDLTEDAGEKDRLLFLMEAGVILHSMGEYKKSNLALDDAYKMAETIKTSISKEALSFFLSDRNSNFTGENFERVLLQFYKALNYIEMNDYAAAKRSFRKLDYDLKTMKFEDDKYKQNLAARYLDGIISESLGEYNDARVQYANMEKIDPNIKNEMLAAKYVLAVKEKDARDKSRFSGGSVYLKAFNKNLERTPYDPNMGEMVIIHQAGKAPAKRSRGMILKGDEFYLALRAAVQVAVVAKGGTISTTAVLAMMGTADNPIPIYKKRDETGAETITVLVNGKDMGKSRIFNDYAETALNNYNDNYAKLITRNVASIATKVVLAALAAKAVGDKAEEKGGFLGGSLGRLLVGAGAGRAVAATVKPDLRCWRLLPSNYQIKRIFLEPGEYTVDFVFSNSRVLTTQIPDKVVIKKGQPTFLNFRSMSMFDKNKD